MADQPTRQNEEGTVPERTVPGSKQPSEGGTVPEGTVPGAEQERFEALVAERDEYLNDLRRVAAEFENYRKRTARDQADFAERANERLVKELLPVLDDLARALEAAEKHEEAKLEEGVRLVHRQLAGLLRREGLAEIETDGKFDPHVHEALLSQPSEAPEGSVIDVVQKGYKLGDRVLRPARVVVAAAPPEVTGGDRS